MCLLSELTKGQKAIICGYGIDEQNQQTVQRLVELGFMLRESLQVIERAWSGSPLIVELGGSSFALGQEEAAHIHVQVVSNET